MGASPRHAHGGRATHARALTALCVGAVALAAVTSTALYAATLARHYPANLQEYAEIGHAYPAVRLAALRHHTTHDDAAGDDAAWAAYALLEVECVWDGAPPPTPSAPPHGAVPDVLLVFFLPGNSGSAMQGLSWACAATLAAAHAGPRAPQKVRTFAFDFAQQANVHRGRLVGLQADYVAHRVAGVLRAHEACAAWLVGHSMGGVVARTAATLLAQHAALRGVLTLNSPHAFPPLFLDRPMRWLYAALARAERPPSQRKWPRGDDGAAPAAASAPPRAEALVQACGGGGGYSDACHDVLAALAPAPAAPPPPPLLLLSLTSGEMDLQVEQATTVVATRPAMAATEGRDGDGHRARAARAYNMQDARVCGYSTSHDKILHDMCALAFAADAMLRATADATAVTERGYGSGSGNSNAAPPVALSALAAWGRRCVRHHLWQAAAAAFALRALLAIARPAPAAREPVLAAIVAHLCAAHAAVAEAPSLTDAAADVAALAGPVAAGVCAATLLVGLVRALTAAAARVPHTRRLAAAALLLLLFAAAAAAQAPAAVIAPVPRAALWLALALLTHRGGGGGGNAAAASLAATRAPTAPLFLRRAAPARRRRGGEHHATAAASTTPLLAALYAIQLQPFFAWHNAARAHTHDSRRTIDPLNGVAEVAVVLLTLTAALWAPRHRNRRRRAGASADGAPRRRAISATMAARLAYGACVGAALAYVAASPRETGRVLIGLLATAPACAMTAIAGGDQADDENGTTASTLI